MISSVNILRDVAIVQHLSQHTSADVSRDADVAIAIKIAMDNAGSRNIDIARDIYLSLDVTVELAISLEIDLARYRSISLDIAM